MKIDDPGPETLSAATAGNLRALDRLLLGCQPGVFNLASCNNPFITMAYLAAYVHARRPEILKFFSPSKGYQRCSQRRS